MNEKRVTVNAKRLTNSETETLLMALEMTTISLEDSSKSGSVKGIAVSEHLANVSGLIQLVRNGWSAHRN